MKTFAAIALLGAFANAQDMPEDMMPMPTLFEEPMETEMNVFYEPSGEMFMCSWGTECEEGQYWNALACECFNMMQCRMACPEGQDLIPTERCECAPQDAIKSLFPEWAAPEDVMRSMVEGAQSAMDERMQDMEEDWDMDHDSDDHDSDSDDMDEKKERFEDAVHELEEAANDLFGYDSAVAKFSSGIGATIAAVAVLNY